MTFQKLALSAVASVRMGSPAPQGEEYFSSDGKPFVRVQDVGRAGRTLSLTDTKDCINDRAISELRPVFARKGTIVFPKSGAAISTNSRAVLGVDAYVVSHLAMVEAIPEVVDTEWLFFYLCTVDMGQFSRTAALPSLRLSELAELPVPVPALPEQRRIVDRIKQCLERVEEIEGLRRSATQEASDIEFACFHDALLQGAAEKGWPIRTLGDVAKSFRYGTSQKAHVESVGVPVLRMGNIQRGHMNYSNLKYIEVSGVELDRYRLAPGDILINRTNSLELVGKAATFDGVDGDWIYASYLVRVEVDRALVLPEFVTAVINSRIGRNYVMQTARRAIGMVNLNAKEMAKFPMPLPSLREQQKVVNQLQIARPLAEQMRAAMAEPELEFLKQSILRKAFAGEL